MVYLLCFRQLAVKCLGIANINNYLQHQTATYKPMHNIALSCDINETLMTKGQPWLSSSAAGLGKHELCLPTTLLSAVQWYYAIAWGFSYSVNGCSWMSQKSSCYVTVVLESQFRVAICHFFCSRLEYIKELEVQGFSHSVNGCLWSHAAASIF